MTLRRNLDPDVRFRECAYSYVMARWHVSRHRYSKLGKTRRFITPQSSLDGLSTLRTVVCDRASCGSRACRWLATSTALSEHSADMQSTALLRPRTVRTWRKASSPVNAASARFSFPARGFACPTTFKHALTVVSMEHTLNSQVCNWYRMTSFLTAATAGEVQTSSRSIHQALAYTGSSECHSQPRESASACIRGCIERKIHCSCIVTRKRWCAKSFV